MAKAMVDDASTITIVSGAVVLLLMLLFILLLVLLACKPWRFLSRSSRSRAIKANDLERPLVSEDLPQNQSYELARDHALEAAYDQSQGALSSLRTRGLPREERFSDIEPHFDRSDSFVLEISEASEDIFIGQTLKRPLVTNQAARDPKHGRKEDTYYESKFSRDSDRHREIVRKNTEDQRRAVSILALEVISGPSHGLRCSVQSTNTSRLPLTLGRVSPSDLLLKDSEVSGKHAMINWNLNKLRWELVDMGSLNGTLLNSLAVGHPDSGSRHWSDPIELASGDIITVGTTSKIFVQITSQTECQIPFGFGVASDPMALRRGGKKLPMEDVCYYHWPLSGADQFGLFGICDGHGGASAATSASKIMPEMVASILSDSFRRERVLSQCDASDVLAEAFSQTEACMNHYYEGCTATVLLVWADGHDNFFAQCANVGDSACVMNIDGKQIKMTEDHRIVSCSERLRIEATGEPLKEGETRLCGLNLGRMLGDKFLKQQDARFSTEPYISQAVCINRASKAFVLLASDGFWDVISFKKAVQIVNQTREKNTTGRPNSAEKIASILLSEARTLRTKDNTSIIFLDFDTSSASTIHSSKT